MWEYTSVTVFRVPSKKRGIGQQLRRNLQSCQPVSSAPSPSPATLPDLPDVQTSDQADMSSSDLCDDYHQCVISLMEPGTTKYIDPNCELSELEDSDGLRAHEFYVITDFGVKRYNPTDDTDACYISVDV